MLKKLYYYLLNKIFSKKIVINQINIPISNAHYRTNVACKNCNKPL